MSELRRNVEARGKNVEDAIQKGLVQLGVRRDQVDIYIITEGSRGILGIGAEDARVRLTVLPPPAPPPPPPAPPRPVVVEAPRPEPLPVPVASPPPPPVAVAPAPIPAPVPAPVQAPPPSAQVPTSVAASKADIETIASQTVNDILGHMGLKPKVNVRQSPAEEGDDGPAYLVDVRGSDLASLIGRRGEGLDALQYLTRLIVQHKTGEWASVVIDIEGYRERRSQTLRDLAQQMADRVKRDGRSISLEPMPPYERRIVHLTLRDNPAVMTMSIGEGDTRKVTIRPKK